MAVHHGYTKPVVSLGIKRAHSVARLDVSNLFIDSQHGRLPQQRRLLNVMNSKQQSSFEAANVVDKMPSLSTNNNIK